MNLYEEWEKTLTDKNQEEVTQYLENYYAKEKNVYAQILADKENVISGTVSDIAKKLSLEPVEMAGFIDGINTSLENEINLKDLEEDKEITLDINWETLYFNMHVAKADWLYNLTEWDEILDLEKRDEIAKKYRISKQAVSDKVGRNDPCPCGSGKKYKKCCGKA